MAVAILFNASRSIAHLLTRCRGDPPDAATDHVAGVETARSAVAGPLSLQYLDARQRLAFHPLQERAAGGRHVGEPLGDAGAR